MADLHMMTFTAEANIKASTVIKMAHTIDFGVRQCANGATEVPFGIAQNWNEGPAGTPFDTGFAASTGKRIKVWAPGAVATAAVQQAATLIPAGFLVGANVNSEIVVATTGYAVGWVLESGSLTLRTRLRLYVHPMCLCSGGQGSTS